MAAAALCFWLFSGAVAQQTAIVPADGTEGTAAERKNTPPAEEKKAGTEPVAARTDDPDPAGGVPAAQTAGYVRPTSKERFRRYVNSTVGPLTLARNAGTAGFATITNSPEEWERSGTGFARRFGSGMVSNAIKQTTIYGLDEALELDSRFYKSKKRDFGSRVGNALLSTVTARNTRGRRVVGVPRLAGTYAAGVISREAWYPDRYSYRDGLRSGTISLGFTAAVNLFKEFF